MKKYTILLVFLVLSQFSFAQDLNAYRYVIIPEEYEFLKEKNQYQLAELTKFLFEKEGFESYLESNVPQDVKLNGCDVLRAELEEDSGLFVTRLFISLKDCNNKVVFTTEKGKSREKDYERAYQEALREAFNSIATLEYNHNPVKNVVVVTAIPVQTDKNVKEAVSKSIPEPEEKENAFIENEKKPAGPTSGEELSFTRENAVYYLNETSSGYNFYQKGMAEPFAALLKSSAGETYIYSSVTSKGMASFNSQGDLVVEIVDSATGNIVATVYKKQLQ